MRRGNGFENDVDKAKKKGDKDKDKQGSKRVKKKGDPPPPPPPPEVGSSIITLTSRPTSAHPLPPHPKDDDDDELPHHGALSSHHHIHDHRPHDSHDDHDHDHTAASATPTRTPLGWGAIVRLANAQATDHEQGTSGYDHTDDGRSSRSHHHPRHSHTHDHHQEHRPSPAHIRRGALPTSFIPSGKAKPRRNIVRQLGSFVSHRMVHKKKSLPEPMEEESFTSMDSTADSTRSSISGISVDWSGSEQRSAGVTEGTGRPRVRRERIAAALKKLRTVVGTTEMMRELRLRREEYARKMDDLLAKQKAAGPSKVTHDHPYLALRKKIEAMSQAEGITYSIHYRPFSTKRTIHEVGVPIYATKYDNERKKQARRRQFMFGIKDDDDRYDFDAEHIDEYAIDPKHDPHLTWTSRREQNLAYLAMIFSTANILRFPHVCYINGGIIFFCVYCFLMVVMIQPLILFEMLIGQFSWKGEWGFSHLHRFANGFCFALLFVNVVFSTLQNSVIGYTALYTIQGLVALNPGECDPKWGNASHCIPYSEIEDSAQWGPALATRRQFLESVANNESAEVGHDPFYSSQVYLSTEIWFGLHVFNWDDKSQKDVYHAAYLAIFLFFLVLFIPSTIQTHVVTLFSKIWIHLAVVLPVFLLSILLHQYIFRHSKHTPWYFAHLEWDRVPTLVFWCDAFEMALTTVGVGYGGLIRISTRNEFKFMGLRRLSWRIVLWTVIFCLLSALVVFMELALVGELSGATAHDHVLAGADFGVAFVCFSGALLKMGGGHVTLVVVFFGWITIFNFWPLMVTTQMGISYLSHWLPIKNVWVLRLVAWGVTAIVQIMVVSLYVVHAEFAETDSFDLFGGSGAACVIIAAEIGIAFIFCGFREFMTDIEIMQDTPMSIAWQVQMRYFAPPAVGVAYLVIAVSWFFDPPRHKRSERVDGVEVQTTSQSTFWVGFIMNAIPMLILPIFGYWGFQMNRKKVVVPVDENSSGVEKSGGVQKFWKGQSRWAGRRAAVISRNKSDAISRVSRMSIFAFASGSLLEKIAGYELRLSYTAHCELRDKLRTLHGFLRARVNWITLLDKILAQLPVKRHLFNATKCVLRHKEMEITVQELSLLRRMIRSSSTLDLSPCALPPMGRARRMDDKEGLLFDHLLNNVPLFSEDESSDSSDSEEDKDKGDEGAGDNKVVAPRDPHGRLHVIEPPPTPFPLPYNPRDRKVSVDALKDVSPPHSTSTLESGNTSVYRKVVGKPKKTEEELKLDLAIRIRKRIDLPYEAQLAKLILLRDARFAAERAIIQRFDPPPEEFFITVRIAGKVGSPAPFNTGFRVILLHSRNHFVLTRLPSPRPPIVTTTRAKLRARYPGSKDFRGQVFSLAISTLKKGLGGVELETLLTPPNRTSLLKHLNEEIYGFIHPQRSVVVVVEETERGIHGLSHLPRHDKWRWLTPPLRRKGPEEEDKGHVHTWDWEELTIADWVGRELEEMRRERRPREASDIVWHNSGEAFTPEVVSTQGHRRSEGHEHEVRRKRPTRVGSHSSSGSSSIDSLTKDPLLLNEERMKAVLGRPQTAYSHLPIATAPHLTESDWRRRKEEVHHPKKSTTLMVIHQGDLRFMAPHDRAKARWIAAKNKIINQYAARDAFMQPLFSLPVPPSDVSISMRPGYSSSMLTVHPSRSVVEYSNLMNEYAQYKYAPVGGTLVISPQPDHIPFGVSTAKGPLDPDLDNLHPHAAISRYSLDKVDSSKDSFESEISGRHSYYSARKSSLATTITGGPRRRSKIKRQRSKAKVRKANRIKNITQRYGPQTHPSWHQQE